ncbi:MAG: hypothetical protein ACMUEL_02245 [Flavobacteriales bacterium Tduv]
MIVDASITVGALLPRGGGCLRSEGLGRKRSKSKSAKEKQR